MITFPGIRFVNRAPDKCSINVVVIRKVLLRTFHSFDSPFRIQLLVTIPPHLFHSSFMLLEPAALGKINATQKLLCVLIPCILVQDNHSEWPIRIHPATIRSYCFLHSLKSFAETNSTKTAKKKAASNAEATLTAWRTAPQVYYQRRFKLYQVNATNHTHATFLFNFLFVMLWTIQSGFTMT